jgi:hypothetical protein
MNVKIPTSLKDIPLSKWAEIQDVYEISESEMLTKLKVISIICDIDFKKVSTIELSDINKIDAAIQLMFEKSYPIDHFEIDGVKFGFIPNLETMSGGEFIDLENYMGNDIFKAMAVMYRPIKKQYKSLYSIEKYEGADKYSELMKRAPTSAYLASSVFFYTLGNQLAKSLPNYIQKNLTALELQTLENGGVGTRQLMQLLEGTD